MLESEIRQFLRQTSYYPDRRNAIYKRELTDDQWLLLESVANNDHDLIRIGRHIIERGLPLDVALHALRAARVFQINLKGIGFDPEYRVQLQPTSNRNPQNAILSLRFAEFLGKVAASEQEFHRGQVAMIRYALKEEKKESGKKIFQVTDPVLAQQNMLEEQVLVEQWESWELRPALIELVRTKAKECLEKIIPAGVTIPEYRLKEIQQQVEFELDSWDTYFDGEDPVFNCLRRAEAITAVLEQQDLDALSDQWLFKKELQIERRRLEDWVDYPEVIVRVKERLAGRMEGLLPMGDPDDFE